MGGEGYALDRAAAVPGFSRSLTQIGSTSTKLAGYAMIIRGPSPSPQSMSRHRLEPRRHQTHFRGILSQRVDGRYAMGLASRQHRTSESSRRRSCAGATPLRMRSISTCWWISSSARVAWSFRNCLRAEKTRRIIKTSGHGVSFLFLQISRLFLTKHTPRWDPIMPLFRAQYLKRLENGAAAAE